MKRSAGLVSPEIQRRVKIKRRHKSRRNIAARKMCLVFLNAIASRDSSMIDLLSVRITVGPDERMLHDGVELHVSGSHVAEQSPRSDGASALRPQGRREREETFWVDTTIFNH